MLEQLNSQYACGFGRSIDEEVVEEENTSIHGHTGESFSEVKSQYACSSDIALTRRLSRSTGEEGVPGATVDSIQDRKVIAIIMQYRLHHWDGCM